MLRAENLTKTYQSGDRPLTVLDGISFEIDPGTSCAVVGPSGSGKTTLLGLCAGLDRATSGDVYLKEQSLGKLDEDELAVIRNRHIGFVFQSFQLIPTLTALENVMVPMELRGAGFEEVSGRAEQLLGEVGLAGRIHHYPTQLSGGEQQRVGIARAFIHEPDILFADEPTGNLDEETGTQVEEILFDLNRKEGTTLVIVTHDPDLAAQCDRIIRLKGGRVVLDQANAASQNDSKASRYRSESTGHESTASPGAFKASADLNRYSPGTKTAVDS